jgi:hypothetical protein
MERRKEAMSESKCRASVKMASDPEMYPPAASASMKTKQKDIALHILHEALLSAALAGTSLRSDGVAMRPPSMSSPSVEYETAPPSAFAGNSDAFSACACACSLEWLCSCEWS